MRVRQLRSGLCATRQGQAMHMSSLTQMLLAASPRRTPRLSATTLKQLLIAPVHPLCLPCMANESTHSVEAVLRDLHDLSVRLARCYQAFAEPVMQTRLALPNATKLRWLRGCTRKELCYGIALEQVARARVAQGSGRTTCDLCGQPLRVNTQAVSEGESACGHDAYLHNTDDYSCVDDFALLTPLTTPATSTADTAAASPTGAQAAGEHDDGAVWPLLPMRDGAILSPHVPPLPCSREDVHSAIAAGDTALSTFPFEVLLELLRPQHSLLDVVVNEATICAEDLNQWFRRFLHHRVAWRVLHEHLLHLTHPQAHPTVVQASVAIMDVLHDSAASVARLYARMFAAEHGYTLTLDLEEDKSLLTSTPPGRPLRDDGSSWRGEAGGREGEGDDALVCASAEPPESATMVAVGDHLRYIFREVLKNACLASFKRSPQATVRLRYAEDARWVCVDVVDTAGGIPERYHRDIWKFGWTTSTHCEAHLGGLGVGLPMSKVFVDLWGGSMVIYTMAGRGTTTRIRMPKAATEVLPREHSAS